MNDFKLSDDFLNEFGDPTVVNEPQPVKIYSDTISSAYRCAICNAPVSKRGYYLCPQHYAEYKQVSDPRLLAVYKALFKEVENARSIEDQEGDPDGLGNDRVLYLEDYVTMPDGSSQRLIDIKEDPNPPYDPTGETDQRMYELGLYAGQKLIQQVTADAGLSMTEAEVWQAFLQPILNGEKVSNAALAEILGIQEAAFNKYLSAARSKVRSIEGKSPAAQNLLIWVLLGTTR